MKIRFQFDFKVGILFFILLLYDALAHNFSLFQYFEEIYTVIMVIILMMNLFKKRAIQNSHVKKIFIIWGIFVLWGVLGNIFSGYQTLEGILLDMFNFSKFFICLFASFIICKGVRNRRYESTIVVVINIVTLILFFLVVHDSFFDPIYPYLADRYGTRSLKLFFSNQTYLAVTGVLLIVFQYCFGKDGLGKNIFIIMSTIITLSTFRTKAIGFCGVALLIIFVFSKKKTLNLYKIWGIGIIVFGVAILLGWDYLEYYFFSGNQYSLRLLIWKNGLTLAENFFPFGSGFGTYCSLGSKINYSLAYDLLGMRNIYMRPAMYDMFWGTVVGQFGFGGAMIYVFLIIQVLFLLINFRSDTKLFWASLLMCAYLFIASLGESSFNTYYACLMGTFLGYATKVNYYMQGSK